MQNDRFAIGRILVGSCVHGVPTGMPRILFGSPVQGYKFPMENDVTSLTPIKICQSALEKLSPWHVLTGGSPDDLYQDVLQVC